MDRTLADQAIESEELIQFAHFGPPDGGTANMVCLFEDRGSWWTCGTDERAVVQDGTVREFTSEAEALTDFIDGLRELKKYLNLSR